MQIKSMSFDGATGTIAPVALTYNPNDPKTATNVTTTVFDGNGSVKGPIVTTAEAAREVAKNGALRVLFKISKQLPAVKNMSFSLNGYDTYFTGANETMSAHLVVNVPRTIALALSNNVTLPDSVRTVYLFQILQAIVELQSLALHQAAMTAPAQITSLTTLWTKLGEGNNALMRALYGLNPVDTTSGVYGVAV